MPGSFDAAKDVVPIMQGDEDLIPKAPPPMVQFSLFALAALEGADNSLLGASTDATMEELNFSWIQIGNMNLYQGVATNFFAMFWGVLADRGIFDRKHLLMTAAVGQGVVTILLSLLQSYGWQMIFLRILNGVFLSGLRPITNGVIADRTSESIRGKIFSRAQCAYLAGLGGCNFIVLRMAVTWYYLPVFGLVRGWRLGWIVVGMVSIVAAIICGGFFPNDKKPRNITGTVMHMIGEELCVLGEFLCLPTFFFMVLQGFFGSIPWTVMWVMNRYYLYGGDMNRTETAFVTSMNPVWGVVGTFIGGYVADFLAKKYGVHGRPLNAQLTVALGVPLMYLNFIGIPPGQGIGGFWVYLTVNFVFGILGSWAQGGTNFPILSEIVPAAKRSRVLAVEGALENSLAQIAGSNAVPLLSNLVFGFDLDSIPEQTGANPKAARAIGYSLGVATAAPWLTAYVVYSILHWSYPRELRRRDAQEAAEGAARGPPQEKVRSSFASMQYKSASIDHLSFGGRTAGGGKPTMEMAAA